jgi:hypothetical protein
LFTVEEDIAKGRSHFPSLARNGREHIHQILSLQWEYFRSRELGILVDPSATQTGAPKDPAMPEFG